MTNETTARSSEREKNDTVFLLQKVAGEDKVRIFYPPLGNLGRICKLLFLMSASIFTKKVVMSFQAPTRVSLLSCAQKEPEFSKLSRKKFSTFFWMPNSVQNTFGVKPQWRAIGLLPVGFILRQNPRIFFTRDLILAVPPYCWKMLKNDKRGLLLFQIRMSPFIIKLVALRYLSHINKVQNGTNSMFISGCL